MNVTHTIHKLAEVPERVLELVRPTRPYDFLRAQPPSFADVLPYESFVALERPTCLLSDGALGLVWEISPLSHEVMAQDELSRSVQSFAEIFEKVRDPRVSFQVIFDAEPSREFATIPSCQQPKTVAQKIMRARMESVANLAEEGQNRLRLMKRRILITARLSNPRSVSSRSVLGPYHSEIEAETQALSEMTLTLKQIGDEVEYVLRHAGFAFYCLGSEEFLGFLRRTFHSFSERKSSAVLNSQDSQANVRLGAQILRDFVELTPSTVAVGNDTWQVTSWLDQPPTVFDGLFARLLEINVPHRLVVNIRSCTDVSDLETKKTLLKNATDSFGELQRDEVKATQDRLARGEGLSLVSLHLLVRNVGISCHEVEEKGAARTIVSRLKTLTQIDFLVERYAAPALFLLCLPLAYSDAAAGFSGRERRVLSRNVAPYLPLFGGFQGTRSPFQLMVSRAGDAAWLNPFDSQTSAHVAVLGSSGCGKSFFQQNMMMSLFAKDGERKPRVGGPLLFCIDKKTSYEIFANVMGEEFGSQIVKPPEYFPNIFKGKLDEYRLPVIVGILKTAVSLVTKDAALGAIEEMVLAKAVQATFEQNELDARTEYTQGTLRDRNIGKVKIPRLSDVVDNLFPVCGKIGSPAVVAETLAGYLSPFVGSGPYAALFDKEEFEEFDPPTPGISLFDIDSVASHPVLSTLTTQMILSEILRQIRRSENLGRPGMLVIEEAGVLSEGSPELVSFIRDSWKTFRKLGFSCVGLTNEVDDYVRKAGPREIWNVSPNKIILKMTDKDLQKARSGSPEHGHPPLIENAHMAALIGSLRKEDGLYSQGLWWSDEAKGTFVFMPTGFDYWCAASKPIEVATVHAVRERVNSYFEAVAWLAGHFPRGVLDNEGRPRSLEPAELPGRCV